MTGMPDDEIADPEVGVHRLVDAPSIKQVAGMFAEANSLVLEAAEDVLRDGRPLQ